MNKVQTLLEKLTEEAKYSCYPTEKNEIRNRYRDTALLLFKKQQGNIRGSFLSFGSRRSSVLSSYGNTPTVIRRSFSSNGMIEYTTEQVGATRWKRGEALPTTTPEETEFKNVENENLSSMEADQGSSSGNDYLDSSRNRKSFSHYDFAPSKRHVSNPILNGPQLIHDSPIQNESLIKDEIMNLTSSAFSKIDQCEGEEVIEKSQFLPNINGCDTIETKNVKSQYQNLKIEPRIKTKSVNEKSSLIHNTPQRKSLNELPRQSPSISPKSLRQSTNEINKEKLNDFTVLNINGTNFPVGISKSSKSPELPNLTNKTYTDESIANSQRSSLTSGTNYSSLPVVDDISLSSISFKSVNNKNPMIKKLADDGKVNESFFVVHPSSESSSIGLAPISPRRQNVVTPSNLTFRGAFNRNRHQTSVKNDTQFSNNYLYSKQKAQVQLIKYTSSREVSLHTHTSHHSNYHYVSSKSLIRSLPYETQTNDLEMDVDFSQDFTNTNSSRLCTVM